MPLPLSASASPPPFLDARAVAELLLLPVDLVAQLLLLVLVALVLLNNFRRLERGAKAEDNSEQEQQQLELRHNDRRKVMSEPSLTVTIGRPSDHSDRDPAELCAPILISPISLGRSLGELQQIPTELWHARRRIEAGLREQRRQKAMLEHVQDQLGRYRLRHARSHSPPASTSAHSPSVDEHEGEMMPQRPSTSCWVRHPPPPPDYSFPGLCPSQIGARLAQLELQMDRVRALAGDSVSAHLQQQRPQRGWARMRAELAQLRMRIGQLRTDTRTDLQEMDRDLSEALRVLTRRARREWSLAMIATVGRRGTTQPPREDADALRKRCAELEAQKTELIAARADSERRAERVEQRRDALERTNAQIWASLGPASLNLFAAGFHSSSDGLPEDADLPAALRAAIAAATDAERTRWQQTLEEHQERWSEEKRDTTLELQQREQDWLAERAQARRELDKWREEARQARAQAESTALEASRERVRVQEAERESRMRAQRAEDEMAMMVETQRSGRERAEAELEAERARNKELLAQYHQTEADLVRLEAELRECRAELEEARKEREEAAEEAREEKRKMDERMQEQRSRERRVAEEEQRRRNAELAGVVAKLERDGAEAEQRLMEADAELGMFRESLTHAEERLDAEREARRAEAERTERDWSEQLAIVGQLEARLEEAEGRAQAAAEGARHTAEQRLQREMSKWREEQEAEREQTEQVEQKLRADLQRARAELARNEAALAEARERETMLTERIADADHRLGKAAELCRRLNAELDDMSERSVAQNGSAERLRAELTDVQAELVLVRGSLDEQRRRNAQLETELRSAEKAVLRERESRVQAEQHALRVESEAETKLLILQRELKKESEREAEAARSSAADPEVIRQIRHTIDTWTRRTKISVQGGGERTEAQRLERVMREIWERGEEAKMRLTEAEQENSALGAQLASARQLLLAQQADIEHREQESRTQRAKLAKAELSAREREERTRAERAILEQEWRLKEESWSREKARMAGAEAERSRMMARLETEHRTVTTELVTLRAEKARLEQQHQEQQRIRREAPEGATRIVKAELARERADAERTRAELREVQRKLGQALHKADRAQAKLDRMVGQRAEEQRQMEAARKRDAEWAAREGNMHAELEQHRAQLRKAVQDAEGTKRAANEAEAARRELERQLTRVQRERGAQKQHIEALEMDRRRVEAVMRQTVMERNALDRTLGAMDEQHAELQSQCTRLQAQVERMGRAEGTPQQQGQAQRKRIQQLEAELVKAGQERRRLDKVLDQRTHGHEQRLALAEAQLAQCRAELEAERRRHRKAQQQPQAGTSGAKAAESWRP